jgi:ATPase subunit of ABC transporter with duplicated ATPase domains
MSQNVLLDLVNLGYSTHLKTCFESFTFRIHRTDRIGIIGPNGSGKSTLLKILLGITDSSFGTIIRAPELSIGYLPQNTTADENSNVYDIASEAFKGILSDLKKLEEIASSFTKENEAIYEELIDRITLQDGFSVPSFIESLLDQFNLLRFKDSPVTTLSGGEKMQLNLVRLLSTKPDIIFLDEPTNHLDQNNRKILIDFLINWKGAALVVSHDVDFLNHFSQTIWSFEGNQIETFKGNYDFYESHKRLENQKIVDKLEALKKQNKKVTSQIQEESHRAAQSRKANKNENDRVLKGAMKLRASATAGKNAKNLNNQKDTILSQLSHIRLPEVLKPKFSMINQSKNSLSILISEGKVLYKEQPILENINVQINSGERVVIKGPNGSGKSTFLKALLKKPEIYIQGNWFLPQLNSFGYLDQHYSMLNPKETVLQSIEKIKPEWPDREIRKHLNDFLFRKNEEIHAYTSCLSGGEQARLCLAQIAALSPSVLLLDEVTNNIDNHAKDHLIQVLNAYKGTLIVVSHDQKFLEQIEISRLINIDLFKSLRTV